MMTIRGGRAALICIIYLWPGLMSGSATGQPMPVPRPPEFGAAPIPDSDQGAGIVDDHPMKNMERGQLRRRMKICAERWTEKKHNGSAAGILWSDFARECLEHP